MNSTVQGALLLTVVEIIADSVKAKVSTIANWCSEQFVVSLEIRNTDEAFEWVEYWLNAQPYAKTNRRLLLSTFKGNKENDFEPQIILTPAPGQHVFTYKGNLLWLKRNTNKGGGGSSPSNDFVSLLKPKESFHLTVIGRSQEIIRELIADIQKTAKEMLKQKPKFYTSVYGCWYDRSDIAERPIESVILPDKAERKIIQDLHWFLDSAEWYKERCIPYRRGYLFHGIPGSGKSTLAMALASELGLNLYMLNLSSRGMNDETLMNLIHDVKDKSMILFEDIDIIQPARDEQAKDSGDRVSLSGLLNVIDGPSAREGCVVFMTTNYKDKLDKALIRAGRTDIKLEFSYATSKQIFKLYKRFFQRKATTSLETIESLCNGDNYSMADIQEKLIENRTSPKGFIQSL